MLVYSAIASLDGYVADADGRFEWSAPDEEVHAFVNDLERPVGTFLLGRRMYEVLVRLGDDGRPGAGHARLRADLARGRQGRLLAHARRRSSTARTRIEREFDPEAVRRMRRGARAQHRRPGAGRQAIRAGLVDELRLFVSPVVVGGGTAALPDGVRWQLELVEERRFGNGVVFLRYRSV